MDEVLEAMNERQVLEHLTEFGYLEGPSQGIALQVIDKGRRSLRGKQNFIFEKFIEEPYLNLECERCSIEMPMSEIVEGLHDGLCSFCRKMMSNDD